MTPNLVPSTFFDIDYATLITKPSLSFLSFCLAIGFPMYAFFAIYLKSKIIMRNVRNGGVKHCENIEQSFVLECVFGEVRDFIEVWIVNEHRVIVHRSDLVELVGLETCVEGGLGQVAKLLVLVRRCACPALVGQVSTARTCGRQKSGMVSKWPSRNSKHGWDMRLEKVRWREMTRMCKEPFWHPWAMRVPDTHEKCGCDCARAMCGKMCVRVCTPPVVHTVVTNCYMCTKPFKNSVKKTLSSKK